MDFIGMFEDSILTIVVLRFHRDLNPQTPSNYGEDDLSKLVKDSRYLSFDGI